MLLVNIDRRSRVPVYRQICERVVKLVDDGALAPGDRLPPTRALAGTLGVHRSTVLTAYAELWALGYLESRAGSYSTVRRRTPPLATRDGAGAPAAAVVRWEAAIAPAARRAREDAAKLADERNGAPGLIDFARLAADPDLAPHEEVRRSLKSALVRKRGEMLDYADPRGYQPLREVVARRMRAHGIAVSADEVVITNGAQQGLDLVARVLAKRGGGVALESPTYSMALSLFRLHGLATHMIPMRPDGMDLDALARVLARRRLEFVYTVPNFHNPTGITTDQPHRERLLALCESHRVPLVEDGFEEEMKYFGKAVLPIKSMDARESVLYLGTFSKVVFPGLRVGWVAAPRACVDALVAVQRFTSLGGNTLAQAAAAQFCGSGAYETYLRRVHRVYRRRMQTMLQCLRERLPASVEWTRPAGGYTLWLALNGSKLDEGAIVERCLREGVKVVPGRLFFAKPTVVPHLRLSIACVDDDEIVEGCARLGRALAAEQGAGAVGAGGRRAARVARARVSRA
ncbi:MAG TPA: PLP-dependent aminotransferase family protein [Terriglobales bacterium]|nr:PLP-dependent aminotransferase family protein [Terriglobales bacterium]